MCKELVDTPVSVILAAWVHSVIKLYTHIVCKYMGVLGFFLAWYPVSTWYTLRLINHQLEVYSMALVYLGISPLTADVNDTYIMQVMQL